MPTDYRRINGPECTFSPHSFIEKPITETSEEDSQSSQKIDPIFLKVGVVCQAAGSAYIEQNETKIICSVYGPREVTRKEDFSMKGQLTCDLKFATFSCQKRRSPIQDNEEEDLSIQLLEALEPAVCLGNPKFKKLLQTSITWTTGLNPVVHVMKVRRSSLWYWQRLSCTHKFPKSQVNIYLHVLQHNKNSLAAAITCASVALAEAGVEMYDLVAGHTVSCDTDTIGSVTIALMPSLNQISTVTSKGNMQFEFVIKAIKTCVENCQKIYPVLQHCLTKSVQSKLKDQT